MKKQPAWIFLLASNALLLCAGFFLFLFIGTSSMKELSYEQTAKNLRTFAIALRHLAQNNEDHDNPEQSRRFLDSLVKDIAQHDPEFRLTIIDSKGLVQSDSDINAKLLENHSLRPEVKAALAGKEGSDIRVSTANHQKTIYFAIPMQYAGEKLVMRLSIPVFSTSYVTSMVIRNSMLTALLVLIITGIISFYITRQILQPLQTLGKLTEQYGQGNFDFKTSIDGPREFWQLSNSLQDMAFNLKENIAHISRQKEETDAVFAGITEALFVYDEQYNILKTNSAAEKLFKINKTQCIQKPILEVIRSTEIIDFISKKNDPAANEIEVELTDTIRGTKKYLLVRSSPIAADDKKNRRFLLVLTDITRLKKLEQVRQDFVANVSHELKTPVTSIKGFIETLQDGAIEDRETSLRFLDIMNQQSNRLIQIIEDLLSISRMEQQHTDFKKEQTELLPLLAHIAELYQNVAARKQSTISVFADENLSCFINPGLMEEALTNLVDNSIKYSQENASITLFAHKTPNGCSICVQDNGPGIPIASRERIFERFYRIDKGRSRDSGGTGLGLSIVRHIVLLHGGTIKVTKPEDLPSGSLFTIDLPDSPDLPSA